jgi:L,D-transpeptidase YcbB
MSKSMMGRLGRALVRQISFTGIVALQLFAGLTSPSLASTELEAQLLGISEHLMHDGASQLSDGGKVIQPALIAWIYGDNDYQAIWPDRERALEALSIIGASDLDGLDPRDYHHDELMSMWRHQDDVSADKTLRRARFDVLLTDGLLLYARHLLEGKMEPHRLDPSFNYKRRDFIPEKIAANLKQAIQEHSLTQAIDAIRPSSAFYLQMKAALVHYRALADAGRFRPLSPEVLLKPGQSHSNIVALRKRLRDTGYLDPDDTRSDYYDDQLVEAMRQFQQDHGLDVDGIVGRQSYELLNLSYAARVDSLRINMDRLRWLVQDPSREYIVVNIAGFELYYIRHDELIWETPVMTGTVEHQTPIFTERLKYLEFNPTWTVPRSIILRSLLPKFKANPNYVVDNNYDLIDRAGKKVNPLALNWSALNNNNFPYSVVQQPGENNALGRVKFIFPNRYAVYLHDTPSRALFSRSARAFSSGCVRVKQPLLFAQLLLDDPETWPLSEVEALVESRKPQQRVFLKRDIDINLMYWTTSPTRGGKLQFHRDIYNKDAAALVALNTPPRVIGLAGG